MGLSEVQILTTFFAESYVTKLEFFNVGFCSRRTCKVSYLMAQHPLLAQEMTNYGFSNDNNTEPVSDNLQSQHCFEEWWSRSQLCMVSRNRGTMLGIAYNKTICNLTELGHSFSHDYCKGCIYQNLLIYPPMHTTSLLWDF